MFKKLLQSLSKSHGRTPPSAPLPVQAPAPQGGPGSSVLNKVVKPSAPVAAAAKSKTPEELCGVTPKMTKDEIHQRLKMLYRRYNRAASSLNPQIRAEAERMLEAMVVVREKHFGEI